MKYIAWTYRNLNVSLEHSRLTGYTQLKINGIVVAERKSKWIDDGWKVKANFDGQNIKCNILLNWFSFKYELIIDSVKVENDVLNKNKIKHCSHANYMSIV